MSRNGSGTYSLPAGNPVVTGTTIASTWANNTMNDLASAMTDSVAADGQTAMTGNLNLNSNKIVNVADPTLAQDAATKNYTDTAITTASTTYLAKASNLSDVANATTSRTNISAAKSGANSDITSLTGLTTPLSQAQGGTGTSTGYYGFKNRIINGAMVIDQRNAGASVTAVDAVYNLDRWRPISTQTSKFTVQQTPSATETGFATRIAAGFTNYMACTSSSAYSVGASDAFTQGQFIEGLNCSDLAWGTASAKTVTLSFWVYSSLTGTFGGSISNSAQNRSYPFSYTISVADTWEQKSVTVAGDTSGTWLTTNGVGIRLWFSLGAGSTYSGTAGAWSGSQLFSVTGATSVVGTNGATFYITGVQLEVGSTATSFDYRPYGTELILCQRYYWKQDETGSSNTPFATLAGWTSSDIRGTLQFPVPMRTNPTWSVGTVGNINCQSNGISYAASGYSLVGSSTNGGFIKFTISGGVGGYSYACFANVNPVNSAFSAEL